MFEDLIREVQKLSRSQKIPVPLPTDREGYLDRLCPNAKCKAEFKVLSSDWDQRPDGAPCFCPKCRNESPAQEWATPAQIKYAKAYAFSKIKRQFSHALETGTRRFNQTQRPGGLISFSLSFRPDATPVFLPSAVGEALRQRFSCEKCGSRYSSLGAAYFCPACGHNSILKTFDQTIATIRNTIGALPAIRQAMASDPDAAQNTVRQILEQCMEKLVGGFEHFTRELFISVAPNTKFARGSFQRPDDASTLWQAAIGKSYDSTLSPAEMRDFIRLIQQRHVLTHCNGIVDEGYLKLSGDCSYSLGQRLVVQVGDAHRLAELVEKIAQSLRASAPKLNAPTQGIS